MKKIFLVLSLLTTAIALEDATLQEFKSGNNLLTSDIYKLLTEKISHNFLVSPFSVETVVALTASGAKNQTAEEIRTGLRLPNEKKLEEIFSSLISELRTQDYVLESANKIYVKENFELREEFKTVAVEIYRADLQNIDFNQKKEAAKEINSWVEAQTKNKIRDILSEDVLNEATTIILINALYFKGNWSVPFELSATSSENFYPKEKEVAKVDTMHILKGFNYYECSEVDAKFLELPFQGKDASMVVVLPNDRNGILNLESKIDKVFTPRPFTRELVQVALPRFKIGTSIDFTDILKKLGIKKVFGGKDTNLSGIAGKPGDLKVSRVFQKTFIEVAEEGVEAAAATLIDVLVTDAEVQRPVVEPKTFIANHPFIFYIKVKGVVLIGGRVLRPQ